MSILSTSVLVIIQIRPFPVCPSSKASEPAMIQSVRIRNFKGIRDVEVGLERLTVFVGPNASGKTSILQGLDLLVTFATKRIISDDLIRQSMMHYGFFHRKFNQLELSCTTTVGNVRFILSPGESESSHTPNGQLDRSIEAMELGDTSQEWRKISEFPNVEQSVGRSRLFRFDAAQMAVPSSGVGVRLADNGSGLASTLAFMALNQPENFLLVQQELKEIVPSIERIRFERTQASKKAAGTILESIIFDVKGEAGVSTYGVSEGTLLVLGLLTAMMNQHRPNLILLDDLDRGLHPLAQRNMISLLRKVLKHQPDLQIIATTHSPYLVDSLCPEEVRMTTLREDGTVACGRLDEHPDFPRWRDEFLPGELWSMFGEKWVADRAPEVAR